MFDLGMQELIIIFVVALLVFGPKKLPELSRALGKGVRELRIALHGLKDSVEDVESQIEETVREDVLKDNTQESGQEQDPEKDTSSGEEGSRHK